MLLIGSYSDVSIFICEVVVFYLMAFTAVSLLCIFLYLDYNFWGEVLLLSYLFGVFG